jgi:hypothetical protein
MLKRKPECHRDIVAQEVVRTKLESTSVYARTSPPINIGDSVGYLLHRTFIQYLCKSACRHTEKQIHAPYVRANLLLIGALVHMHHGHTRHASFTVTRQQP